MAKIAWFGTYYHGTSPEAKKKILEQGLRADMGGAAHGATAKIPGSKRIMSKAVKDKVTMTPSKTLAKLYGMVGDPVPMNKFRERLRAAMTGRGKDPSMLGLVKDLGRLFVHNQPLQVRGRGLGGLKIDPFMPGIAMQSTKNIPARLISEARPSVLGKILRKMVKR